MATLYQLTKIDIINANRHRIFRDGRWADKYLVAVSPYDSNGEFAYEPLKSRGYVFGGKNAPVIDRKWVKPFDSEEDAEREIDVLCEQGI